MGEITITEATIGGARLAVINNRNRTNFASTLLTSYVHESQKLNYPTAYNKTLVLGGVPLSLTLCSSFDNPSDATQELYYALDIIKQTDEEDSDLPLDLFNPSNELESQLIVPTDPADTTFTLNGNRLSASRINNRYYMNIMESQRNPSIDLSPSPTNLCIFMGVPMMTDASNELIINASDHNIKDVYEFVDLMVGGTPLTAGRIGNNYYLIVKIVA